MPVNDHREPDEELLLAETADGAGVALYIDPAVLGRLEASDPLGALTEGNLADYCTALEGVSHFLYSIWRLECDAPVSLLELECQAEVDKYAATVFLVGWQQGGSYPTQVHARLFDRVEFDARLEPEQFDRYRTAHRCAANFCRRLERRFVSRGDREDRADGARAAQVLSPGKRGEASLRDFVILLSGARGCRVGRSRGPTRRRRVLCSRLASSAAASR